MRHYKGFFRGFLGLLIVSLVFPAYGAVWYVSPDGSGDGATWETAGALQAVMNAAAMYDEVWVTEGTYTSLIGAVLNMKTAVNVYGGFAGTETDRDQRDPAANPTVLDGQETWRCVIGADAGLDGFTITNGFAEYGGGMYNNGVSPVISNCSFIANNGSALYNSYASPTINNCIFSSNTAAYGAGIYTSGYTPRIVGCVFTNNKARYGGAIYSWGQQEGWQSLVERFQNNMSIYS